jgi:nitroreductase
MDALEAILSRNSVPAKLLGDPAPDGQDLEDILESAMRAPDHGALRPWRFIIFRGDARAQLGEVFAEALKGREPDAGLDALEKERGRPLRSPLIIAVCAEIVPDVAKVPPVEQIVTCGAAAQNMMNTAHAKGYAAIMLTGANAHDPYVKESLGLAPRDEIVGFLYFGTPSTPPRPKARPSALDYVREWSAPVQVASAE